MQKRLWQKVCLFCHKIFSIKKGISIHLFSKIIYYVLGSVIRAIAFSGILIFFLFNFSCGNQKEGEFNPKIITNKPPSITSVDIQPKNPNKGSNLNLIIQCQDPERDPVTYLCQWIKNDEEIPGEDKNVLESEYFRKGDLIQVRLTPSDGNTKGKTFLSQPIKILNSPPVIQEVQIEPKRAYANDSLKASIKSYDTDGDSIYYTYRWEKNGEVLSDEGEVLEIGRFIKGDSIAITITPDDQENKGSPKRSESIKILNSPPIIVSSPPTSVEGNDYSYRVKGHDPDNDPISFNLKSAPKGMEIDQETGLVRWTIQSKDRGTHSIEIEASDQEGAKSFQRFVLNVEIR